MEKKLLFSLTAKDFEVQTFCTGGAGGQHRNAKKNGVRIIHTASGAAAMQKALDNTKIPTERYPFGSWWPVPK